MRIFEVKCYLTLRLKPVMSGWHYMRTNRKPPIAEVDLNKYMRHRRLPSCSTLMTALLAAVLVVNTFLFGVSRAQAETLEELQAKVEQTNSDYDAANQRVTELQKQLQIMRHVLQRLNSNSQSSA